MKILFYHSPREWTGTSRVIATVAKGLSKKGHTVRIVVPPDSSAEAGYARSFKGNESVEILIYENRGSWFTGGRGLRRLFRRWESDFVVAHTPEEHFSAALACWLGRRGTVLRRVPPGGSVELGGWDNWPVKLAKTKLIFSSEADARAVSLRGKTGSVEVAELGMDPSQFPEKPENKEEAEPGAPTFRYILCIRDPNSRGRAAMAIRTLARLSPRHDYLRLVIVGPGSDDEDLRMQAAALDVLGLVSLLGDRDDSVSLMQNADLGWVVAEGDSGALGALDLMSLGVPVLAQSNGVAARYIADGINGAVLPADDPAMTAARVVNLLGGEEQMRAMGQAGRSRVERDYPESGLIEGFERAITGKR
ncbi:MAG: glycosyltransferase [Gemmatimonadaceae bacterium]|nr:glycosyltransferase [Gemmatimonadaceae bacterium]